VECPLLTKEVVPAISGLGKGIWAKAQIGLGQHELLYQGLVFALKGIHVVDHLGALIAHKLIVLKLHWTFHLILLNLYR
jgi:hypothetical protein